MAEQITKEEVSLLEKFRQKAIEFRDAWDTLTNYEQTAAEVPELDEEYQELHSRGSWIMDRVNQLTRAVDAVTGWFGGVFGSPERLGALPLIPIAAITAAVAYMSKWVADVYLFERKVTEYQKLKEEVGHDKAAEMIGDMGGGGIMAAVRDVAKPAGIAVGIWAAWQLFNSPKGDRA